MIDLASFFQEKKTPDWFKHHEIFKEIKHVNKIFPSIGLPNFSVESTLNPAGHMAPFITNLLYTIEDAIVNAKYYITAKNKKHKETTDSISLLDQLYTQARSHNIIIAKFKTKKGLYLHKDIIDTQKITFAKNGESLFKVYNKLNALITKRHKISLTVLDTCQSFKDYSSNNINGKSHIVFSSDGNDGAWDILTMSMRGISSCQSWTGGYKVCTIGSVLDPFTAIMYLTAGTNTEYGSKMIRRCIVRFVVNPSTKTPCLFMEYMYPSAHPATMEAFKQALQSKVGNRFPIITKYGKSSKLYVPYSETTKLLVKHSNAELVNKRGNHNQAGILPYRDYFLTYKTKESKQLSTDQITKCKNQYFISLNKKLKQNLWNADYINLINTVLTSETFEKVNADYSDISKYYREVCYHFFKNKTEITQKILKNLKAQRRKQGGAFITFKQDKKVKIVQKEPTIANTLTQVVPFISDSFKDAWQKTILSKKKIAVSNPV